MNTNDANFLKQNPHGIILVHQHARRSVILKRSIFVLQSEILIFMHGKLLGLEESDTRSLNTERNR